MRRAKWPSIGQRAARQMTRDRMDHRHFQQLARRQPRQDRRQALRKHRLAGAWRPAHQQIVAARRRHFERALGAFLAPDVTHVGQWRAGRPHCRFGPAQDLRSLEMIGQLDERARRQNVEIGGGPGRFGPAGGRADKSLAARIGGDGGRQDAGDRADRPIKRQFADHRIALQRIGRNGADRRHYAERNRQIVMTAFLGHIGGGEIDCDSSGRQGETRGDERRSHALAQLSHRLVAEADDHEGDIAACDLHLNIDRTRLNAFERNRRYARDHCAPA